MFGEANSQMEGIFTPKTELHRIKNIEILPITICDHAPLVLSWDIGLRPKSKQWQFNASLLHDKGFRIFVATELKDFLEINATP